MNWQPIETAPKDGTLILTYSKDYRAEYSVSYWCQFDEEWQTDFRQKGAYQQVVDLALRVDKNGNVLPQREIKPTTVKEEK